MRFLERSLCERDCVQNWPSLKVCMSVGETIFDGEELVTPLTSLVKFYFVERYSQSLGSKSTYSKFLNISSVTCKS